MYVYCVHLKKRKYISQVIYNCMLEQESMFVIGNLRMQKASECNTFVLCIQVPGHGAFLLFWRK